VIEDLTWPLNSEVLHDMSYSKEIYDLEKEVEQKYKHLEDKIVKRNICISEKDIKIFKNILDRNGGGVIIPRHEAESAFKVFKQLAE
jgi:hypothetical protein